MSAEWKLDRTNRFYESLIESVTNRPKIRDDDLSLAYYPKSRYADLIDAAKYCHKWFEDGNDHIVDLDNLLVWDHKQSEPIAKVTNCEMVGGPGSAASLKVEAVALTKEEKENMVKYNKCGGPSRFGIKRVIFSDPATIVFWEDGTKTVVKAHNEDFDPEKGLAMAVCKRVYGDKYHRVFKDHCPEDPSPMLENISKQINDLAKELKGE